METYLQSQGMLNLDMTQARVELRERMRYTFIFSTFFHIFFFFSFVFLSLFFFFSYLFFFFFFFSSFFLFPSIFSFFFPPCSYCRLEKELCGLQSLAAEAKQRKLLEEAKLNDFNAKLKVFLDVCDHL
jgi:hypothetical protein